MPQSGAERVGPWAGAWITQIILNWLHKQSSSGSVNDLTQFLFLFAFRILDSWLLSVLVLVLVLPLLLVLSPFGSRPSAARTLAHLALARRRGKREIPVSGNSVYFDCHSISWLCHQFVIVLYDYFDTIVVADLLQWVWSAFIYDLWLRVHIFGDFWFVMAVYLIRSRSE